MTVLIIQVNGGSNHTGQWWF